MPRKRLLELVEVANVIDPFFEGSDIAGSEAYPPHSQAAQLMCDVNVLGQRGNSVCFIDAHLQFEGTGTHRLCQVPVHLHGMRDDTTIFCRCPEEFFLANTQVEFPEINGLA